MKKSIRRIKVTAYEGVRTILAIDTTDAAKLKMINELVTLADRLMREQGK